MLTSAEFNNFNTEQALAYYEKVQVGIDQEKAQSEKDSHSKNRGGKKQTNNRVRLTYMLTAHKGSQFYFYSFQFRKIITRYRRIGYNLNVMRQSACLVFNPIMVDNYAAFFNCTPVDRASDSMMAPT